MIDKTLDRIVQQVLTSAKYRDVHPDIVARVAAVEMAKRSSPKEALKATKRKLHQIGGAYLHGRMRYDAWRDDLESSGDEDELLATCQRILATHASTHERLPEIGWFYETLLGDLPTIHSIVDLACGMNPLAAPWMALADGCRYTGIDIYGDMMAFLQDVTPALGVTSDMRAGDIISCALPDSDVALVFKALPVLDQVDPAAGLALLERIPAPVVIVTYPAKSLGRRDKGMPQNYRRRFEQLLADKPWGIESFEFESELAFRVRKD